MNGFLLRDVVVLDVVRQDALAQEQCFNLRSIHAAEIDLLREVLHSVYGVKVAVAHGEFFLVEFDQVFLIAVTVVLLDDEKPRFIAYVSNLDYVLVLLTSKHDPFSYFRLSAQLVSLRSPYLHPFNYVLLLSLLAPFLRRHYHQEQQSYDCSFHIYLVMISIN